VSLLNEFIVVVVVVVVVVYFVICSIRKPLDTPSFDRISLTLKNPCPDRDAN
jgi:hypothetical protein